MSNSLFVSIVRYLRDVLRSFRSLLESLLTAIPYLFGIGELRKEVTEQYPDPVSSRTEDDLPPKTRGFLFNDIERCTGCGDCAKVCPTKCIQVEAESGRQTDKNWVSTFDIDFGVCIFCGLCVEVCEPGSLVHTKQFEGAVYSLDDLVTSFGRGKVSAELKGKWAEMRQVEESP